MFSQHPAGHWIQLRNLWCCHLNGCHGSRHSYGCATGKQHLIPNRNYNWTAQCNKKILLTEMQSCHYYQLLMLTCCRSCRWLMNRTLITISWWWWMRRLWLATRWWWWRRHLDWRLWQSSLREKTLTTISSTCRNRLWKSTSNASIKAEVSWPGSSWKWLEKLLEK